MFYRLEEEFVSIAADEISKDALTIGYVNHRELEELYRSLGFSTQAFEESRKSELVFSPIVRFYDGYILMKLDVSELQCHTSLFVSGNLFLAVSNEAERTKHRDIFMDIISKTKNSRANEEIMISSFLERLMDSYKEQIEELQRELDRLELNVSDECTDNDFNKRLLLIKNRLLTFRDFFEQVSELCERLNENGNELLDREELLCLRSTESRADRYREKTDLLRDNVNHIWDSYQAYLDIRLNRSMKTFTVLTTVFFPTTVIVGWYGMNFRYMPELEWKYGYLYVTALTIGIIAALIIWFRKKKWI